MGGGLVTRDTRRLREVAARLRRKCPVGVPVRIVRVAKPVCDWKGSRENVSAYCSTIESTHTKRIVRFRITLARRLRGEHLLDVLAHEWAHCMDRIERRRNPRGSVHDARWGQLYSKAWRNTF